MEKKITQTRKIAYLIIIAAMISASIYVVYVNFFESKFLSAYDPDQADIDLQDQVDTDQIKETKIDFEEVEFSDSFLKKAPYINLRPAPNAKPGTASSGRANPFVSFQSNNSTTTKK